MIASVGPSTFSFLYSLEVVAIILALNMHGRKCYSMYQSYYLVHITIILAIYNLHRACNKSIMTGSTSAAGSAYPSTALEVTPWVSEIRVVRSLDVCLVFCTSLFVLFSLFISPLYPLSFFDFRLLTIPFVVLTHYLPFSIQSCRFCYATQHLCQRSFYKIFVKFRNS